jgi:hypothetical protein
MNEQGQSVAILKELQLPVMEPIMSTKLRVSVYDWDAGSSDDRVATLQFDYQDVKDSEDSVGWGDSGGLQHMQIQNIDINGIKDIDKVRADRKKAVDDRKAAAGGGPTSLIPSSSLGGGPGPKTLGRPTWYNMYGAPEGKQSDRVPSAMNRGFIPGSFYRGRVLLSFKIDDATDPKAQVTDCPAPTPEQRPEEEKYVIQFDLYEGSEIPDKGDMEVQVCIGTQMIKSSALTVKEGRAHWYTPLTDLIATWPKDLRQVPDIFVYLAVKAKRVSFVRFNFEELVKKGWRNPPQWTILQEDPALDALDEDEFPGALLFSIRAGAFKDAPAVVAREARPLSYDSPDEFEEIETKVEVSPGLPPAKSIGSPNPPRPISKIGTLMLTIVEAVNLPAMDSNGFSDPFCKIKIGDKRVCYNHATRQHIIHIC